MDRKPRRIRLAYITDLAKTRGGGGSFAVNWHIQEQLRRCFDLVAPSPIVPRVSLVEKFFSRVERRLLKRAGKFYYFSPATLERNAMQVSSRLDDGVDALFFRSATRWCHCRPPVPYFIYLDVVFKTFFENTFAPGCFREDDLSRVFRSEARFLEAASAVFFESEWGLQMAREAYGLAGDHYVVAHRGGVIEPPGEDAWQEGDPFLLSVAMNFEQKGGDLTLAAFKELRRSFPGLRWHVIGGKPTGDWEEVGGIVHEGILDPERPEGLRRLRELFSRAFALVHPTREDTNPLVITEAAYFGCPAISVNRFAIPELVRHDRTGILLEWPVRSADLVEAVGRLLRDRELYLRLRRGAFQDSRTRFDWNRIGARIAGRIGELLA